MKPLTYLAALRKGLQPNTLVMDAPITLAPIGATASARQRGFWSPRNYDGGASGAITLRRALENSRNLATAQLLATGLDDSAEEGLNRVCELAMEAQLYKECMRYYPFVLGAQAVRLIDLAAFYAAIANEGALPRPHAIETIEQDGRPIYRRFECRDLDRLRRPRSFYQLKSMLQGVLARGTARAVKHSHPMSAARRGPPMTWPMPGSSVSPTSYRRHLGGLRQRRRRAPHARARSDRVQGGVPMFEPILQAAGRRMLPGRR